MNAVGAARQDDRNARTEDDPRRLGRGKIDELLRDHVSGLEVRGHEDVRVSGDLRPDALCFRRIPRDGVVDAERPVQQAAGDLAPVEHLAERRRLDRGWYLRIDPLDRREERDLGQRDAQRLGEIDGVLDDVALCLQVGKDVDCRVGDEEQFRMVRNDEREDVVSPAEEAT